MCGPAVGAIDIIHADQSLALRTTRTELATAAWAEVESRLHGGAALRAGAAQRPPQNEVEKKSQAIGNEHDDERPQSGAHGAAFSVAVHVADEKKQTSRADAGEQAEQEAAPSRRGVLLVDQYKIEEPLRGDKNDAG